ncbi:Pentatricopeptide repeat-containing protein [Platanthera guangdongensis]|uniref:Pentatricopeptide repeat-containing protein n=1 Tax=Platanthera guangdongensis TaxID=2320717 RepID=A0ABR2LXF4_9ASPA
MGNPVLTTRLITMYFSCGSSLESQSVFKDLEQRNLFQWNAMISGYSKNELWEEAIALFCQLLSETELKPNNFTLPCLFKSCAGVSNAVMGRGVHGMILKLNLASDTFVNNSLTAMYGKCGFVDEAVKVFDRMPERTLVSWNTLLSVLSDNGLMLDGFELFLDMVSVGEQLLQIDDATLVTLLPMCAFEGWIELGRLVHGLALKAALHRELRVNNALIDMYGKCGSLVEAQSLFEKTIQRNVVSWNAMIGACARNVDVDGVFELLHAMSMEEGMRPNEVTILNVLPACLRLSHLHYVKQIHDYVVRNGLEINSLVPNALVAAYAKCGSIDSAENVFNRMELKTVSSWNALIGGCAQNGDPIGAVHVFLKMTDSGLQPDWFTIGSLLLACAHLKYFRQGRSIHGFIQRNGLDKDSFISISQLSFYIQCRKMSAARTLFSALEGTDSVSWNAMISGCSQNGMPDESLELFRRMQRDRYEPSLVAITGAFIACGQLSALRLGKETHCCALKANLDEDAFVGSSIVDMYAKCGSIDEARSIFDRLNAKDDVSWNVMITGYGVNGRALEAVELFGKMQEEGLTPDEFTYIGILMACSHGGLVEVGLEYFEQMRAKGVERKLEHYACAADLLGRAGRLNDAIHLIEGMPEKPDARIWSSLLGSCRIHGDITLGERAAEKLLELDPNKAEHYVLTSNLFAGSGRWDDVRRVRKMLRNNGLRKDPGCSWIDVKGQLHCFTAGDGVNLKSDEICRMWSVLEEKISKMGYVPDTGSVLHEVDEAEKLVMLRRHSEKQAVVFGLLSTGAATKIRVNKNIRMCRDCHCAIKLVSKVARREIVVRDNKRFHHFRDGFCSCKDYW